MRIVRFINFDIYCVYFLFRFCFYFDIEGDKIVNNRVLKTCLLGVICIRVFFVFLFFKRFEVLIKILLVLIFVLCMFLVV